MAAAAGILAVFALFVWVWGSMFANIKLFGVYREMMRNDKRSKAQRRRANLMFVFTQLVVWAYIAFIAVVHPFGLRDTFIYFGMIPFLVIAPTTTLVVGIRAYRRGTHF